MKIRPDALAVSSILFTLALLIPLPTMLGCVSTVLQVSLDIAGRMGVRNYYALIGFASLTIILIGLIVTWAGYINGVRWTWFVMLLITCVWAFPVLVLAEFHWRNMLPISEWPPLYLKGLGLQLGFTKSVLTLVLMVLALALTAKTFILGRGIDQSESLSKPGDSIFSVQRRRQGNLQIRRGALILSSILFTLVLLALTPPMFDLALVTHETRFGDISDYPEAGIARDQVVIPNHYAPLGITSLAVIGIGLVVTWFGYVKGVRWTWFVMFTFTWVWAFAILLLPVFLPWRGLADFAHSFAITIRAALHDAGPGGDMSRSFLIVVIEFLLMVFALMLPVGTLFLRRASEHAGNAKIVQNPH